MADFLNLPKVSFIVITHNFNDFVCDCLNSIKNQTYKNFEIIVVDDLSGDGTVDKIQNFINENNELTVKFIKNEKNIGQLASFLEGLKVADGEFICQIDGDDVLFPNFCAGHIETHLKTSVALTTCNQAEIDENNVIHTLYSAENMHLKEKEFEIENKTWAEFIEYQNAKEVEKSSVAVKVLDNDKYSFATWHWAPTSSAMMRKSVCELLLLLKEPQEIKITADKFVFSFCHLIGSSAVIGKTLFAYRRHSSNYSLANQVMGNKKYYKEKTQNNYFRNNKKIRSEMFKFIRDNKQEFIEKLNKTNLMILYKRILFSFDRSFFKGVLKAIFR